MWLKKKSDKTKSRLFSKIEVVLKPLFGKLGTRLRLASRLRLLNIRATRNPKKYMTRFLCIFGGLLIINLAMWLIPRKAEEDTSDSILRIDPVLTEFNRIQTTKNYHDAKVGGIAIQMSSIQHQLDSLQSLPDKTHEDSVLISQKYRQIRIFLNNFKTTSNEEN